MRRKKNDCEVESVQRIQHQNINEKLKDYIKNESLRIRPGLYGFTNSRKKESSKNESIMKESKLNPRPFPKLIHYENEPNLEPA